MTITIALSFASASHAQQCGCESNTALKDLIDCKPVVFANNAKLYWQYNCDSSWLVFRSAKGRTRTIFSLDSEAIMFTGRLGMRLVHENKTTFIVEDRRITGCCDPVEYLLFDKSTGDLVRDFGTCIAYVNDGKYNLLLFFDNDSTDLDHLTIYHIDTRKSQQVTLPRGRLKYSESLSASGVETLFEEPAIEHAMLTTRYKYLPTIDAKEPLYATLRVKLRP